VHLDTCSKGKVEQAIGCFESALAIDPGFTAAREDLARLYVQRFDDPKAVTHLEVLVKERPSSVWAWANLSAVRFRLGRVEEAEAAARRTLTLNSTDPIGRYILGISLASQDKNPDEALACLRATFAAFPQGHLAAAKILASRGDVAGTRLELESYLGSHPPGDTAEVKAWLDQHPQHPQPPANRNAFVATSR
jgi:tetratricopeptide (TPR) repeat protein